ncbi:MAG: GTPase HflX [Chlamydiae bacterium]|nr:GTPase HflX [Chlamydiota bacterium]
MSELEQNQQERYDLTEVKTVALVGVFPSGKDQTNCLECLEELESLAKTYGFETKKIIASPIKEFNAATYIGKGKADEIGKALVLEEIDAVIFDDEITPNQQKNLEEIIKRPVLDRTELILEVFAKRAQTKEAMLQIELAKVKYQLPRLKRMWTHLSRQKTGGGGGGALRGEGEKQIEVDKRLLKDRLVHLEREIKVIKEQREIVRKSRIRTNTPTFAIVGYTNAGKSTLLNALTGADVLIEDKLFATLDPTARKFILPNKQTIVLVDTVGFIRKLPHTLVNAFRSTLEEAAFTDILLHVIDVSHPLAIDHAETTMNVLKEIGVKDKPVITLFNKIDKAESDEAMIKLRLKYPKTVRISAKNKTGFDELIDLMLSEIAKLRKVVKLKIPQSYYALASELMREGRVIFSGYEENDILLEIEIPASLEHKVVSFYHDFSY